MCNTNNISETCKVEWICIKTQTKSQFEHIPSEAACNRQFPSPLVARGNKLWQPVPKRVHQFNRPVEEKKKKKAFIPQICGYRHQDTSFYGYIQKKKKNHILLSNIVGKKQYSVVCLNSKYS